MAAESSRVALGTSAPDFTLPDAEGAMVSLRDFSGSEGYLVVFMCNHCPYVQHIAAGFARLARAFIEKGIAVVAINPNDAVAYPEDSVEKMAEYAKRYSYPFPYLCDESQEVARQYQAVCTPDFFLFDKERKLVYRGQMDASRPGNSIPVTGEDLGAAVDAVLEGGLVSQAQRPSIGCSIKWKEETLSPS